MRMLRTLAAIGAVGFSSMCLAQTTFVCGAVVCSVANNHSQLITGIDDLVVEGHPFDMTFSTTQDSTFAFGSGPAAPGLALTGVDAAIALDNFYGSQQALIPPLNGPGIEVSVGGAAYTAFNVITALQAGSAPGLASFDITTPTIGDPPVVGSSDVQVVKNVPTVFSECRGGNICTQWTPLAAPEILPISVSAELTFLIGSLLVVRGRRMGQSSRDTNALFLHQAPLT